MTRSGTHEATLKAQTLLPCSNLSCALREKLKIGAEIITITILEGSLL